VSFGVGSGFTTGGGVGFLAGGGVVGVFNTWTRGGHKYLYDTKTAMTNTPTPSAIFCHKGHPVEGLLNGLVSTGLNELIAVEDSI
jgi:hypothetical protein